MMGVENSPSSSAIPVPDQKVFDTPSFSAKKPGKKTCPSPPSKSPSIGYFSSSTPNPAARTPVVDVRNLFENRFEDPVRTLGKGSFGEVYAARSIVDNEYYAVKKRRKPIGGKHDRENAVRELSVAFSLPAHPHCLRYFQQWEKDGFLCIQTELCQRSLKDYISEVTEKGLVVPEDKLWSFLLDLALGLKHIHQNDIIHVDIKPGNVLIAHNDILKIGDFGLAVKRGCPVEEGDSIYMAPELVGSSFVGPAVDVFSLGATLFEMSTNLDMPTSGTPAYKELRSDHIVLPASPARSPDLENMIRRMMCSDPHRRITIDQILSHPRLDQIFRSRPLSYQHAILLGGGLVTSAASSLDDMELDTSDELLRDPDMPLFQARSGLGVGSISRLGQMDDGTRRESLETYMNSGGVLDFDDESHGSEEAELLGWPSSPIATKSTPTSRRFASMFDAIEEDAM
eukprot:TRINITY_DN7272_c0_g1_i1.p1 TRINITY_DN7272_c0_g1~~TRINITY_DN7272_c0_g1_i1.p1  ORF type:complete len:455 (+),score=137.14 TRINITY_DN7272_c0_g1_i1:174-1538(+)